MSEYLRHIQILW